MGPIGLLGPPGEKGDPGEAGTQELEELEFRIAILENSVYDQIETPESQADWLERNGKTFSQVAPVLRGFFRGGYANAQPGDDLAPKVTMESLGTWRQRINQRLNVLEWAAWRGSNSFGGPCPDRDASSMPALTSNCGPRPLWLFPNHEHHTHDFVP